MTAYDEFIQEVVDLIQQGPNQPEGELAYLGWKDSSGNYAISVEGRAGYVWVRAEHGYSRSPTQALNLANVNLIPDLPVRVKQHARDLVVTGPDSSSKDFLGDAFPALYSREPGYGGMEPVSMRRLLTGLVHCTDPASLSLTIKPMHYHYQGTDKYYAGGTLDLTSYVPSDSNVWRWVKVGIDPASNVAVAVSGTDYPYPSTELTQAMLASIAFGDYIACVGVKVRSGATEIDTEKDFSDCSPWRAGKIQDVGTTSAATDWSVDSAPVSPATQDDEFDDASIDAKWTEYDTDAIQTPSEAGGALSLSQGSQATTTLTGEYQTLPSGDFTIAVKILIDLDTVPDNGDNVGAGIVLWDDATDDTKGLIVGGMNVYKTGGVVYTGFGWMYFTGHNDWNSQSIDSTTLNITASTYYYLRLRRTGTTYYLDFGTDGETWTKITLGVPFTPSEFGVGLFNYLSGSTLQADTEFFRYRSQYDGDDDPIYGRTSGYVLTSGDDMTGTLNIEVATATDEGMILKSTDDDTTLPLLKAVDSSDNVMFYMGPDGDTGVGTGSVTGKLHVDQDAAAGAKPVLTLDQGDLSEEFLRLVGQSTTDASQSLVDAADMTTPGSIAGWFKIYIQDDQATNPIADGVYYVPFYNAPTS